MRGVRERLGMRPGASEDIEGTGELGRRELLWRRYFPVGLGAACLGMFIGFFPSTLPAAVGGLTGLGAAPAPPAVSPAVAGAGGIAAPAIAAAGPLLLDLGSAQPVTSDVPSEVTPVPGTNAGTDTTPAGGNPGAPGSSLIPSTPGCPIPLTTTGTQADAVLSQLQALCTIVVSLVSSLGPVPGASLPAGTPAPPALPSAASATGASHSVAPIWLAVDGAPGPGHPHGPLAVLGMVAGTAAPPALSAAVASVTKAGGTVVLLLAPVTGASLAAFPAWTASTTAALAGVSTAGIVVGAVPSTTVTALADAVASALSAVRHERPHTTIAPWWADGGGTPADAPLARALAAATAGLHD